MQSNRQRHRHSSNTNTTPTTTTTTTKPRSHSPKQPKKHQISISKRNRSITSRKHHHQPTHQLPHSSTTIPNLTRSTSLFHRKTSLHVLNLTKSPHTLTSNKARLSTCLTPSPTTHSSSSPLSPTTHSSSSSSSSTTHSSSSQNQQHHTTEPSQLDPTALVPCQKTKDNNSSCSPGDLSTFIMEGHSLADHILTQVHSRALYLTRRIGRKPTLCVILVGERPDSMKYVEVKRKSAFLVGIHTHIERLPDTINQQQLLDTIARLNIDPNIDGIITQLPLPRHLDASEALQHVVPMKDVDGFHLKNQVHLMDEENVNTQAFTNLFPGTSTALQYCQDQDSKEISFFASNYAKYPYHKRSTTLASSSMDSLVMVGDTDWGGIGLDDNGGSVNQISKLLPRRKGNIGLTSAASSPSSISALKSQPNDQFNDGTPQYDPNRRNRQSTAISKVSEQLYDPKTPLQLDDTLFRWDETVPSDTITIMTGTHHKNTQFPHKNTSTTDPPSAINLIASKDTDSSSINLILSPESSTSTNTMNKSIQQLGVDTKGTNPRSAQQSHQSDTKVTDFPNSVLSIGSDSESEQPESFSHGTNTTAGSGTTPNTTQNAKNTKTKNKKNKKTTHSTTPTTSSSSSTTSNLFQSLSINALSSIVTYISMSSAISPTSLIPLTTAASISTPTLPHHHSNSSPQHPSLTSLLVTVPISQWTPTNIAKALMPPLDVLPSSLQTQLFQLETSMRKPYLNSLNLTTPKPSPLLPCTPLSCIALLDYYNVSLSGAHVVVLGRSSVVGFPLSLMLMQRGAVVTNLDRNCPRETRQSLTKLADIIVTAVGKANFITRDDIKPGAVIIDVGINFVDKTLSEPPKYKIALPTRKYSTLTPTSSTTLIATTTPETATRISEKDSSLSSTTTPSPSNLDEIEKEKGNDKCGVFRNICSPSSSLSSSLSSSSQQPKLTNHRLVGDVDFNSVLGFAGMITPVPGGVGPVTVAMLLRNTVLACSYISQEKRLLNHKFKESNLSHKSKELNRNNSTISLPNHEFNHHQNHDFNPSTPSTSFHTMLPSSSRDQMVGNGASKAKSLPQNTPIEQYLSSRSKNQGHTDGSQGSDNYLGRNEHHPHLINGGEHQHPGRGEQSTILESLTTRRSIVEPNDQVDYKTLNQKNTNDDGFTPLFFAAEYGHFAVVSLLLATPDIDVNKANKNVPTLLFITAQNGHSAIVSLLLATPGIDLLLAGIDVNKATNDDRTPLLLAAGYGHSAVVSLLLAVPDIDVNKATNDGRTPLYIAMQNGHSAVILLLLGVPGIDVDCI